MRPNGLISIQVSIAPLHLSETPRKRETQGTPTSIGALPKDIRNAEARSALLNVPIVNASSFGGLHSAEAAKAQALASVDAEQANLDAAQHKLQQDEALYARAERDRVRYQALVIKEEISRSYYDARETEAAAAAQIQSPQQLVSFSSSEKPARKPRTLLICRRKSKCTGYPRNISSIVRNRIRANRNYKMHCQIARYCG
jgi:hypothetical protein